MEAQTDNLIQEGAERPTDCMTSPSTKPEVTGTTSRCGTRGEGGVALIMVLGVLAVVGMMAAHVAIVSEVTAREAKVAADRSQLRYAAESAAARAFWLLAADLAEYPNDHTQVGLREVENQGTDEERWIMDGRNHRANAMGFDVQVAIQDANSGLDFSGNDARNNVEAALRPDDTIEADEQAGTIDEFLDILADYVDPDDYEHLHGKENELYEDEGLPGMPRNAPIQFRGEILWLEGFAEAVGGTEPGSRPVHANAQAIRLVPPTGFSFSGGTSRRGTRRRTTYRPKQSSGRPSFFGSPPQLIRQLAGLTDQELRAVLDARERWEQDGTPLTDTMDPELLSRLQSRFSFDESGVATIEVTATAADGAIRRALRVTRGCQPARNAYTDMKKKDAISCWERVVF